MLFGGILVAAALLLSPATVDAKAVFAHFMVSNTADYNQAAWENDIRLAKSAGIDGFALNMANGEKTTETSLPKAFAAANSVGGFKLLFSFDYAGNGSWPSATVTSLIQKYKGNGAYFLRGSQPLVSTFEGPESAADWKGIKETTDCFFMPDWSSLGAKDALAKGNADGLFSWAAWPTGPNDAHTYDDASYFHFLGGKPYMAPVSPWFYTNLPGFQKNWLWRGDNLWFDRWQQLIFGEYQPDYLQIISWNDYGESHYIGPLNDKAYEAFDRGRAPFNYVKDMPHDGWRDFLPYHIQLWKTGTATVTKEGIVSWYRLSPANACADGGTTGNTASQLLLEFPPAELSQDKVFFTALLGAPADVSVTVGGTRLDAKWTTEPHGGVGLYHGSVDTNGVTGPVTVTITRSGAAVLTFNGREISASCPGGLTNWNAWVGSQWGGSITAVSPPLNIAKMVCTAGTGANNFAGLCSFTCRYGYCPEAACTCTHFGPQRELPDDTGVIGYPLPGSSPAYDGLCKFSCNHGYCPPGACGTVDGGTVVPNISPFSPPYCTAGVGNAPFQGLCSYSCNWGFCPMHACTCTGRGALNVPPPVVRKIEAYTADGSDDRGLCKFACERGTYCPEPCRQYYSGRTGDIEHGGQFFELPALENQGFPNNIIGYSYGLIDITNDFTTIYMDSDMSDVLEEIFGHRDTCTRKARRTTSILRRDTLTDCIYTAAMLVAQSKAFVESAYAVLRGDGAQLKPINTISDLPVFNDEAVQAAFSTVLLGIYDVLGMLELSDTQVERAWLIYAIMNIVRHQIWNIPSDFERFSVSTRRNGVLRDYCPPKEQNSCTHPLCEGGSNEICTAFFRDCPCEKGDCPSDDALLCEADSCGGADSLTGRCKGNGDQHKGCPCVNYYPGDGYEIDSETVSYFTELINAPKWKAPEPPKDPITCYSKTNADPDKPEKWKFIEDWILNFYIDDFCNQLGDVSHSSESRFERTITELPLPPLFSVPAPLNVVDFKVTWKSDSTFTKEDCKQQLGKLRSSCDVNASNPYAMKWGGEYENGDLHWYITPTANRVAIERPPDTDWWRFGDGRHSRTHNEMNPEDDKNRKRYGKNNKAYDLIVIHQCMHAYRSGSYLDNNKGYDCGGIVDISMHRYLYDSRQDCFDNTWEMLSWDLLHEGAIVMYGNHRAGAAGPAGSRCWFGIDKFDS